MAHFEQASLLATAWANTDGVKERALQHSIVQVSKNNKIKRSRIPSGCLVVGLTISVWKEYLRCFFAFAVRPGDLKRNSAVIGLAIKHCGLRPSLAMFEQAAHQFFSLALPRGQDFCSICDPVSHACMVSFDMHVYQCFPTWRQYVSSHAWCCHLH